MTTTSWNISKQLAEAGFEAESDTWKHDPDNFITGQKYWSYDLETLLEALPDSLESTIGTATFVMRKNSIFYEIEEENQSPKLIFGELKEQSNWADTAAKMWLKLKKENLI